MKRIILTSAVVCGFLFANGHNVLTDENISKKVLKEEITKAINLEKEKVQNTNKLFSASNDVKLVISAIKNIAEALFDLKKNDKIAAESKIEHSIKLLNSNNSKKNITPIQARFLILEFKGNIEDAKKMLKEVESLIKEKNYQSAGYLLVNLKDEIDVMEIDLDKKKLEKRLKKVLQLVKNNKTKEALKELVSIFKDPNIIIRNVGIYPLGVIKASYLIQQSHIINSSTKDYKKMLILIKEAKKELKLDNVLGYFYSKSLQQKYKKIMTILNSLEKSAKKEENSNRYNEAEKELRDFKEKTLKKQNNPRYQIIEPSK